MISQCHLSIFRHHRHESVNKSKPVWRVKNPRLSPVEHCSVVNVDLVATVDEGLDISPVGEEIGPLKYCIRAVKPLKLSSLNGFDLN